MPGPSLRLADQSERPIVERLWLMFRHDLSEFRGQLPNPDGTFSFFIVRGARRTGIGLQTIQELVAQHPGPWEVAFQDDNAPAGHFWRRVASEIATAGRRRCICADRLWLGRSHLAGQRPASIREIPSLSGVNGRRERMGGLLPGGAAVTVPWLAAYPIAVRSVISANSLSAAAGIASCMVALPVCPESSMTMSSAPGQACASSQAVMTPPLRSLRP